MKKELENIIVLKQLTADLMNDEGVMENIINDNTTKRDDFLVQLYMKCVKLERYLRNSQEEENE